MHEVNGDRPRLESTRKMWSVPVNLALLPLMSSIWRLEGGVGTRQMLTANCSK